MDEILDFCEKQNTSFSHWNDDYLISFTTTDQRLWLVNYHDSGYIMSISEQKQIL